MNIRIDSARSQDPTVEMMFKVVMLPGSSG
jgi:hypothetical protein